MYFIVNHFTIFFPDDDENCPVKSFVKYQRHLNPKCHALFQRPKKIIPGARGEPWYDAAPLGPNTLGSMMQTLSKAAGLSRIYTDHSLRATTVHILDENDVPSKFTCHMLCILNTINYIHFYVISLFFFQKNCIVLFISDNPEIICSLLQLDTSKQ